jgi:tetratricopeptide (TPR) repeat protein
VGIQPERLGWGSRLLLKAAAALLRISSLVVLALISPGYAAGGLHLRIIVVDSSDKASQIIAALHRGEDFAALAKQDSSDPSADAGGELGAMRAEDLRAELRDALQRLRPGQVSPVIKIPTGYAILQLLPEENTPTTLVAEGVPGNQTTMSSAGTLSVTGRAVVRQTPETSGLAEIETAFRSMPKPDRWNYDASTICKLHQDSVSHLQAYLKTLLDSQTSSAASPTDLLERHYAAALVESYQGHMDEAIMHWEACYRIAQTDLPERVPLIEEALGDVYLHKAEMENGAYRDPGDKCIFPPLAGAAYPKYEKTQDVEKAIRYFLTYLEKKPDDLEVKWILNLAYMTLGKYPDGVPSKYLLTAPATETPGESIGRFVDVAHDAGLDAFQMSGGVIVEDFENRGLFDVVTSGYDVCGHLLYFHNNGDGTFSDRSEASGLAKIAAGANVIQADYNNDGCMDILVLRGGWQVPMPLSLLRNNCDGTFTDVTRESGLGEHLFATQTAAWADIDNDGWLDLFVADEQGPSQLYHNRGDGKFENISLGAGIDRTQFSKGVVTADYDNDGYPDFFVSNIRGDNFLYHNNQDWTFTEVAARAGVQQSWQSFGTWFFDYDNDGWPDLFVASDYASVEETMRTYLGISHNVGPLKLYKNMRNGTFKDVTAEVGLDKVFMPMGANYGDIDNDGFLDFYLGTGNPSYGTLAPNVLMRNKGGKSFVDITVSSGTGELHKTHGIAFADLENNGNEDIVVQMGGAVPSDAHALRVFRNPGHDNHWIAIKLIGVNTNRAAIGARVTVTTQGRDGEAHSFYRTVDSRGSWGASPLEQHVGLGPAARITKVEIWWPTSNTRQEFKNVAMNQYIEIKEFARDYTKLNRQTYRLGAAQPLPVSLAGAGHPVAAAGGKP